MGEWKSCLEHEPSHGAVVAVTAQDWEHPRMLRASSEGYRTVFFELDESRFYWYPERMHWMPLPPPPKESAHD